MGKKITLPGGKTLYIPHMEQGNVFFDANGLTYNDSTRGARYCNGALTGKATPLIDLFDNVAVGEKVYLTNDICLEITTVSLIRPDGQPCNVVANIRNERTNQSLNIQQSRWETGTAVFNIVSYTTNQYSNSYFNLRKTFFIHTNRPYYSTQYRFGFSALGYITQQYDINENNLSKALIYRPADTEKNYTDANAFIGVDYSSTYGYGTTIGFANSTNSYSNPYTIFAGTKTNMDNTFSKYKTGLYIQSMQHTTSGSPTVTIDFLESIFGVPYEDMEDDIEEENPPTPHTYVHEGKEVTLFSGKKFYIPDCKLLDKFFNNVGTDTAGTTNTTAGYVDIKGKATPLISLFDNIAVGEKAFLTENVWVEITQITSAGIVYGDIATKIGTSQLYHYSIAQNNWTSTSALGNAITLRGFDSTYYRYYNLYIIHRDFQFSNGYQYPMVFPLLNYSFVRIFDRNRIQTDGAGNTLVEYLAVDTTESIDISTEKGIAGIAYSSTYGEYYATSGITYGNDSSSAHLLYKGVTNDMLASWAGGEIALISAPSPNNIQSGASYTIFDLPFNQLFGMAFDEMGEQTPEPGPTPEPGDYPGPPSTPDGGDGEFDDTSDNIDIPTPPSTSVAIDTGALTLWHVTRAQLKYLIDNYLWKQSIVEQWTYGKPIDSIVSLKMLPFTISDNIESPEYIYIGTVPTNAPGYRIENQYRQIDLGELFIPKYWGNFMDYSPYTKIEIFLPFIGIREIDTDLFMEKTIHVKYNIDLTTGDGICLISSKKDELEQLIYQFPCSVAYDIPLSSTNYAEHKSAGAMAVATTVGGIAGAVIGSGILPGAGTVSGAMLGKAAIGVAAAGIAGVSTIAHGKPRVDKSGTISSNMGYLSHLTPYVIISRPIQSVPENYNHYIGYPSNITATLEDLEGFTQLKSFHLDGFDATDEELEELDTLLRGGIIL